jgi:hypothetical protein
MRRKKKSRVQRKNRRISRAHLAFRLVVAFLLAGIFFMPGSPVGPSEAVAGQVPEIPDVLLPALIAATATMLYLVRKRLLAKVTMK